MKQNILCQREEQVIVTDFFENVSNLLQDCDDCEEKEKIHEIIHSMNETVSYIFVGEDAVGKTTLLKNIFADIVEINEEMMADICEYRYGEQKFATQPLNGFQKKFLPLENLRGISVIDTKGINGFAETSRNKLGEVIAKCQVVFVVLDIQRISSPALWDVIEEFYTKNMIFFVTKCDLISGEELTKKIDKVKCYLNEAGISAAVFPVSLTEDITVQGITPIEDVCLYIRNGIVGTSPILTRQMDNIEHTGELLKQLEKSFALRRKQYDSDAVILKKIDRGLDQYVINQQQIVAELIGKVTEDINREIDAYENEIISKMNPYKIKERFRSQKDFTDYLNIVNDNYKNMLNDSVNRKVINSIKNCLHELELVLENAIGFFNERENILALNDKFYGSLSVSRKNMVRDTKQNTYTISNYYKALYEASETLFLQVWEERKKYDNRISRERTLAGVSGACAGIAGGMAISNTVGLLGTIGGKAMFDSLIAISGTAGLIVIGAVLGAVIIKKLASTLYEPGAANRMEENVQKCVEQFKEEVSRTRQQIIGQVSTQIKEIFENELASVDGCFTEYRMSVNIDEQKLPIMETKIEEIHRLLNAIGAR